MKVVSKKIISMFIALFFFFNNHKAYSCIYMLDGWAPLSVPERAKSSEIVLGGQVLRTFKSEIATYSAQFLVLVVFKGKSSLRNLDKTNFLDYKGKGLVANISNFGDKGLCYSDVKTSKHYIIFLTTFRGGLSARYDDLFGAAVPWDRENEMSVYQAIGTIWSEWSHCSKSCGGGHETRRQVTKGLVRDGDEIQYRTCNLFECAASMLLPNVRENVKSSVFTSKFNPPQVFCLTSSSRMNGLRIRISSPKSIFFIHLQKHRKSSKLLRRRRTFSSDSPSIFIYSLIHRKLPQTFPTKKISPDERNTTHPFSRVIKTFSVPSRISVSFTASHIKLFVDCILKFRLKAATVGFQSTGFQREQLFFKAVIRADLRSKPQIIVVKDTKFSQCSAKPSNFMKEFSLSSGINETMLVKSEANSREALCKSCCQICQQFNCRKNN